jgi:hypothetical protein
MTTRAFTVSGHFACLRCGIRCHGDPTRSCIRAFRIHGDFTGVHYVVTDQLNHTAIVYHRGCGQTTRIANNRTHQLVRGTCRQHNQPAVCFNNALIFNQSVIRTFIDAHANQLLPLKIQRNLFAARHDNCVITTFRRQHVAFIAYLWR